MDCGHPTTAELVVEVAVSSAVVDRENASLYADAGVPEYWIVLGELGQVEVCRQPVRRQGGIADLRQGAAAPEHDGGAGDVRLRLERGEDFSPLVLAFLPGHRLLGGDLELAVFPLYANVTESVTLA